MIAKKHSQALNRDDESSTWFRSWNFKICANDFFVSPNIWWETFKFNGLLSSPARCVDPSCLLLLKLSSINLWWKANIFRAEPEMLCGDKFRRLFASLIVMQNEKKFPSSLVPLQWVLFFSKGSFMRMEHFGIISFQWLAVYLTNSLVADSCSGMTSNCNDGIESVTAIKSRQFVGVLIWGIRLIGQRLNFRNIALISWVSSWGLTIKFN